MARKVVDQVNEAGEHTVIVPPKPIPWYKQILVALKLAPDSSLYIGVILFLVTGFFITQATLYRKFGPIKAGTNTVKISIQPSFQTMPPGTAFQVWATADNPVVFVTVRLHFDPNMIQLTGDVSTSQSPLARIVKKTTMADANASGLIDLSLALDPASRGTPPIGNFQLAVLPFAPKTTKQNISTSIRFETSSQQVVNPDSTVFTTTAVNSDILLNPPPTPTPTPTPSAATPTPTPRTATPTLASTPTAPPPVDVTNDVVMVQKATATYFWWGRWKFGRLSVMASSSQSPHASLRVTGYGPLRYSDSTHAYSGMYWVFGPVPQQVTVTSSLGGIGVSFVSVQ